MTTGAATQPAAQLPAHEQLGVAFKRAMAAMRKMRGRETHRPGELSYAQYSLLFSLASSSELSARELAFAADVTPATVAQMLESLEADGLVLRIRSPHDRRIVLTSLTEQGRKLVERRRAEFEPRWQAALEEFSEEQLRTAAAVLERVREVFDEVADS
jgi:DNA-binding MarR family transcriptional regulator